MRINAEFYDGAVTATRPVVLSSAPGGQLRIEDAGTIREHAYAEVRIAARVADTPRRVVLADGSACIVTDNDALDALEESLVRAAPVQARGRRFRAGVDRIARLLERDTVGAAVALALAISVLFAVSRWGAPALGAAIVSATPPEADAVIGQRFLDALDQIQLFQPTALTAERQSSLHGPSMQSAPILALVPGSNSGSRSCLAPTPLRLPAAPSSSPMPSSRLPHTTRNSLPFSPTSSATSASGTGCAWWRSRRRFW